MRRCTGMRARCARPPGGVVGQFIGNGLAVESEFSRRHAVHAGSVDGRRVAGVRRVLAHHRRQDRRRHLERHRAGSRRGAAPRATSRSALEAKKARVEAAKVEEKRVATRVKPRIEAPAVVVEKSERVEKERQVPMFDAPKSGELPPLKLLDDPPVHEAAYSQEVARGHVAPRRAQAQGFRRRSGSRGRAARARRHALRNASRAGRQGEPDLRPRQGSRAFAVGDQRARRRSHSRQVGHGSRDPEREARDRHARRDHQVEGLRRRDVAAGDRARQGHRRRAGVRGSRQDAAPADRRHHRLGQIGRHQRHDPVAALQEHGRARAPDHDRSEDARAVGVRGHSASARARGHRHEARRQRVALVRGGDGAALRAHGGARRAQHLGLQPQGEGRHRFGQADSRSGHDRGGGQRSDASTSGSSRISCRCRTSSSSSTSSPT